MLTDIMASQTANRLSIVLTIHNEAAQLEACLTGLDFADELVIVLDRCTDGSRNIALHYGARLVEGNWPLEGDRRNAGIEACTGDWILELDADERVTPELGSELRRLTDSKPPSGYFLVPFDNYIGSKLVRYGWGASFGVGASPRFFARGCKKWGIERVHPKLTLSGQRRWVQAHMIHYVDRDISDMLLRLDRYSTAHAQDLCASGDIGRFSHNIRRIFSRFWKCYIARHGYREGGYGFLIAVCAGLYPILSHLKAQLETEAHTNGATRNQFSSEKP